MRMLAVGVAIMILGLPVLGQEDPDPNSPTPILLSSDESTRLYAFPATKSRKIRFNQPVREVFAPDSKITLFVTNVSLMKGEEASAFRVYTEDEKGRRYRFPVLDMQPVPGSEWIYALTVKLKDDIGYWERPSSGDLRVYVTWRGLASNYLKMGYGTIGAGIRDNARTATAPASKFFAKPPTSSDIPATDFVGYRFSGDRKRFLEQATFGPTVALDQRIRRIGLRTWLAEQFESPYPSAGNPYPDIPLRSTNIQDPVLGCGGFPTGSPAIRLCLRTHYSMYPVQNWFFREAFYGDPQLRHRVSWALGQMWVVSDVNTQQSSWMIQYHKVLSQNAFGNFRNLMEDMTLNPGMGNFLDMVRSTRNNPNENYARELLQLFSIGLFMLNQDGTLQLDGNSNPIPTYTQETVNDLTKVLTGWSFCNNGCPNSAPGLVNYKDPLVLNRNNHDLTAKSLLVYPGSTTTNIAACTGCTGTAIDTYANNSLNQALDNIFQHPSLAPYFSKFMIQHLVTSDPTPAYVGRVSAVFNNNGQNVRGDLRAVVRAILLDPEARGDFKTDPGFGKLREPVQFLTNIARHFNVRGASPAFAPQSDGVVDLLSDGIGQSTFSAPTVFNYYPPGYVVPIAAIPGPEFALLTTGTTIGRANLGNTLVYGQVGINNETSPQGTSINLSEMQAIAAADASGNQLIDVLNERMLHGRLSAQARASILAAVTSINPANTLQRAQQAVYLVATSSQFQIQR